MKVLVFGYSPHEDLEKRLQEALDIKSVSSVSKIEILRMNYEGHPSAVVVFYD